MKFHIEPTDNPTILKFVADQLLVGEGSYEYAHSDEASGSKVARALLGFPFVKKVYITANFIAVQRRDTATWTAVAEAVKSQLETLTQGLSTLVEDGAQNPKKRPVTVYSEMTPNPAVMKFVSNMKLATGIFEFKNAAAAKEAPLAAALFSFPFIKEVFIAENYLSLTKHNTTSWDDVVLALRDFIAGYLRAGKPILGKATAPKKLKEAGSTSGPTTLNDTERSIVKILEEQIKPAVAGDGGNIEFLKYDAAHKRVEVLLQGACNGCPSSTLTLKQGIESRLKEALPNRVESVEAHET